MRDGGQQGDTGHFVDPPYVELLQPIQAPTLRVAALRRCHTIHLDLFGFRFSHPNPPCGNGLAIGRQRLMHISLCVPRLSHLPVEGHQLSKLSKLDRTALY